MNQPGLSRARFSISAVFLTHGLIVAAWASRIPDFQARLHLSPGVLGRSLMMAAVGSVVAIPLAGWLLSRLGSKPMVIATSVGFCLTLPLIAQTRGVFGLSAALLFYGAMAGSMDVAMNSHGVQLESASGRYVMSSLHALFSLGAMAGAALGGLLASHGISASIHFWSLGLALTVISMIASLGLGLPASVVETASDSREKAIKFSAALSALAVVAFSIMLVEGAMADWSALYLRSSVMTGPGLAALGYALFSGAMAAGRLTGDYLTGKLGRARLVSYGALLSAVGLVVALLPGNAGSALLGFTLVGAGVATIIPNTFAASGNMGGKSSGPSLAFVTGAGYLGFLTGPPLIGFAAQFLGLRDALWILVALSLLSAVAAGLRKRDEKAKG